MCGVCGSELSSLFSRNILQRDGRGLLYGHTLPMSFFFRTNRKILAVCWVPFLKQNKIHMTTATQEEERKRALWARAALKGIDVKDKKTEQGARLGAKSASLGIRIARRMSLTMANIIFGDASHTHPDQLLTSSGKEVIDENRVQPSPHDLIRGGFTATQTLVTYAQGVNVVWGRLLVVWRLTW
ncbi:hypothetical protein PROFUN_03921 [Planoprotostelium fungivorum]|uniref:Uncharacterized protein n=1 Tax=Planoprotostelium fungivorum TaxID=1890364 RepID=A0A2P6MTQ1_9EUKA|nr:hypothetical protein PROFUN_03921 [Planoprotostelium fungivorum]